MIGTIASGTANSRGTKPNCVAGAWPNGVSNHTIIASTRTRPHTRAGRGPNSCGGLSSPRPTTAAMKAAVINPAATTSRADMRVLSRVTVSASSS